jgi:hypothetical protein
VGVDVHPEVVAQEHRDEAAQPQGGDEREGEGDAAELREHTGRRGHHAPEHPTLPGGSQDVGEQPAEHRAERRREGGEDDAPHEGVDDVAAAERRQVVEGKPAVVAGERTDRDDEGGDREEHRDEREERDDAEQTATAAEHPAPIRSGADPGRGRHGVRTLADRTHRMVSR